MWSRWRRVADPRGLVQGDGVPDEQGHRQIHRSVADEGAVGQADLEEVAIGFVDRETSLLGVGSSARTPEGVWSVAPRAETPPVWLP